MEQFRSLFDSIMCFLWILVYVLVLIGGKKYNYPMISPITQAIIAPFEFAVLFHFVVNGLLSFDYVSISYLCWSFVEVSILVQIIRMGAVHKRYISAYLILVFVFTCIMCYLVAYKGHMYFFSYFNTFIGEIIWLFYVRKKDYPMGPISLAMFSVKFIGNAISIPVYFGKGPLLIDMICVSLPLLDLVFIDIYFTRRNQICN